MTSLGRGRSRVAGRRRTGWSVSRVVTPGRAGGLLGMIAAGLALSFVTGPTVFAVDRSELPTLAWTDAAALGTAIGPAPGTNAFRVDTAPIEAAIEELPAVASAEVRVTLPEAALVVSIEEREAILAWDAGDRRFLADRAGVLFAAVARDARLPAGMAIVEDRRPGAGESLAVGDRLDAVDLDVATRLGSLTPAEVGSAAARLRVRITDADGFVVVAEKGWTAVFGFYSPAMRSTDMIPGQVRLLRSLLSGREAEVEKVYLASATDGTYVPRETPEASRKS